MICCFSSPWNVLLATAKASILQCKTIFRGFKDSLHLIVTHGMTVGNMLSHGGIIPNSTNVFVPTYRIADSALAWHLSR